jgi:SAM-dependent methyltransferase
LSRDIFGKALMEFWRGDYKTPLMIRRDDGYIEEERFVDILFSKYDKWDEFERRALEHVKGRVLDIGCGAGRHSLWLQEKGFEVVAVDVSPLAVEVSKSRGVRDCRVMDATNLSFSSNSFGTILLMGNNFGVAGDAKGTKRMFEKFCQMTSKDAIVIATSRNPATTDKLEHLKYHELNRKRGRPIGQVTIRFEYKGEVGDWFDLLLASPDEMEEICKPAGWRLARIFKNKDDMYATILRRVP